MNLSSSVTIPTPKGHTKHCHTAWCRSCLLIYKACLLCNAARTKWIREKQRMSTKEKRQRIISFKMAFHIYKALRSLWNSIPTTPCFLNPSNILKNDLQSLPSISTTTFCKFAEFFSWWPHLTCLLYLRNTFQLLFWNMEALSICFLVISFSILFENSLPAGYMNMRCVRILSFSWIFPVPLATTVDSLPGLPSIMHASLANTSLFSPRSLPCS